MPPCRSDRRKGTRSLIRLNEQFVKLLITKARFKTCDFTALERKLVLDSNCSTIRRYLLGISLFITHLYHFANVQLDFTLCRYLLILTKQFIVPTYIKA